MDNQQQKNDNKKIIDNSSFEDEFLKSDLEYLKQLGDLAREFKTQYNAIKEETETNYQRKK